MTPHLTYLLFQISGLLKQALRTTLTLRYFWENDDAENILSARIAVNPG